MIVPHQPLFLAGGAWSIVAVARVVWDVGPDPSRGPMGSVVAWHGHEMLFGFAAAMFAGYALTSMRSWNGAPTPSAAVMAGLLALWALARLTVAGALGDGNFIAVTGGVAFLVALTAVLAAHTLRSGSANGLVLTLFALGMTLFQVEVLSGDMPARVPVLGFAALLSVVGGRIVAAFTWNRLTGCSQQARRIALARHMGWPSAAAILLALGFESTGAPAQWPGACLLIAAVTEAIRLALWLSAETLRDGLLGQLHLGYSWLPIGLGLRALSGAAGSVPTESAALHALAAGAVAGSIHAVAARAVARRADRLRPATVDLVAGAVLWLAAAGRVGAPHDATAQAVAAGLWCAAWALFLLRHGAATLRPTPRPVFSGPRRSVADASRPLRGGRR